MTLKLNYVNIIYGRIIEQKYLKNNTLTGTQLRVLLVDKFCARIQSDRLVNSALTMLEILLREHFVFFLCFYVL